MTGPAGLSAAQHLYNPAAMAAALQSRLSGLPLPTDFSSLQNLHHHHQSLQHLSAQLQQQQQQQQQHHIDASSEDGENMSDDESADGGKKSNFILFIITKLVTQPLLTDHLSNASQN